MFCMLCDLRVAESTAAVRRSAVLKKYCNTLIIHCSLLLIDIRTVLGGTIPDTVFLQCIAHFSYELFCENNYISLTAYNSWRAYPPWELISTLDDAIENVAIYFL